MNASIRQVLVHLDATRAAQARLQLARRLALPEGAAVTALYAAMPSFIELPYVPMMATTVADTLAKADQERRERARQAFDAGNQGPGVGAAWAETSEVPLTAAFVQQAWCADLLVLGQRDPTDPLSAALPADFVESVVLGSGRPALVVPYAGKFESVGRRALIAWKPTRESANAITAALPLLQQAERVHIVSWGEERRPVIDGQRLELDGWLRLHGVQAVWHREGPAPDAMGEMLLSRAADLEADLLVMGCYGHSRARELVLGGVTRTLLGSMTLPVLMAH